jgi:hemolysin activation/secretion protein
MTFWKFTYLLLAWSGSILCGIAADTTPAAPSPAGAPATPALPAAHLLKRVIIADGVESAINFVPPADKPFVVLVPAFAKLDSAELNKRLAQGENQPIQERLLAAVAQVIEVFFQQNDYPAAKAIVPTQNIPADGSVRVIVFLGKIRNINMQGARWFSESLLRQKLQIEQGGVVRFSELDRAISWTNNNPFRRVKVSLVPVADTGEADLNIAVQETMPLRLMLSRDNSGNEAIGSNRNVASISYGNLWGIDHQISYQFITTDKPQFFKGHGLDYRVPLPWRHYLQFASSYIRAKPEFYNGLFVQDGETVTADLRYTMPLRTGDNPLEVYAALNFKESNNNLAFGGTSVQATKTDVFQLTVGSSLVKRDKRGAWAFGASLTVSPGNVNSRNTDQAFDGSRFGGPDSARIGSTAKYIYGGLTFQRLLTLKPGWDFISRGVAQFSGNNLLSSEQINIGGVSSVRGFNENTFSGDHGYVLSNDLMIPSWRINIPGVSKTRGPLDIRALGFVDAGDTAVRQKFVTDAKRAALASAGLGLRMSLAQNLSITGDYGWQLTYLPYKTAEHSRGHVKVSLAY